MKLIQKFAVLYLRIKLRILSIISKKRAAQYAFDVFCTPQARTLKQLPPLFEKAELLQFAFQDYRITGYRWNKGQQAKALVLHGFESAIVNFDQYISALIEKGYEVLAFDAPAHGRSSGKRINALTYRDFIKYVLEQYGPVQAFIAHSFGGLALCLALAETDSKNCRVALIAPASESITAMKQFFQFLKINDPDLRQDFEEIIFNKSGHPVSWFSIRRTLETIQASILWVHDEEDTITPYKDVQMIKPENHPNIQFVITKGLGHSRIYRDPAINRIVIDFL